MSSSQFWAMKKGELLNLALIVYCSTKELKTEARWFLSGFCIKGKI